MAITAAMVKDLRDMTGAGMMDCKKALNETNGEPADIGHLHSALALVWRSLLLWLMILLLLSFAGLFAG